MGIQGDAILNDTGLWVPGSPGPTGLVIVCAGLFARPSPGPLAKPAPVISVWPTNTGPLSTPVARPAARAPDGSLRAEPMPQASIRWFLRLTDQTRKQAGINHHGNQFHERLSDHDNRRNPHRIGQSQSKWENYQRIAGDSGEGESKTPAKIGRASCRERV